MKSPKRRREEHSLKGMFLLLLTVIPPSTADLPPFSWDRISTFAFPGIGPGCGLGKSGCVGLDATYTTEALLNFSRYGLVLVQGSNYSQYNNGSWRATQQHEEARFASRLASIARNAGNKPPHVFPYIAAYAPQAWYEAQARFNDPEPEWESMWLKDSKGLVSTMQPGRAGSCSTTTNEHGNYNQYPWRRLYDWRVNATRRYFIDRVLHFIRNDTGFVSGSFFDDWTSVAARSIPCASASVPCDTCKCECDEWSTDEQAAFMEATLEALQEVIDAMSAAEKLAVISTVDGGCYTTGTTGCTGGQANNPFAEHFTQRAMAMLRGVDNRPKGWRFREAFCNQGSDLPITNWSATTASCLHDVRYLLQEPAASTAHLVHGHGDGSNTFEFLLAAFLIVAQENWHFSCSGHSHSQDPRVKDC